MPSIRYKFRSSASFETVEIDNNRTSISLAELRGKILRGNNSQPKQQGFDLVFSDADTGLELKGDYYQIPSGSSVIVKRVPGSTPPAVMPTTTAAKELRAKEYCTLKPCDGRISEFHDTGVDIFSVPDMELPQFDVEIDANDLCDNEMEVMPGLRLECQQSSGNKNLEIPRDSYQQVNEKNIVKQQINEKDLDKEAREVGKSNKVLNSSFPALQSSYLPLELKCSLCQTFFKEAVMIPCCQHSFCDQCIRRVLTERGSCPKCFSMKCNVQSLLPNLSLRQAIKHFLESQMLDVELDNAMGKYVPDGESGIQAVEVSCGTGAGSNQVVMESYNRSHLPFGRSGDGGLKSAFPSQTPKQSGGLGGGHPHHGGLQRGYVDCAPPEDFQGESHPLAVPPADVHGGGAHSNFLVHGGQRKGVRTCYTCGSPDHLMRDCPASNSNTMFYPGNGAFPGGMVDYAAYWNGSSVPPLRPYANMYGNPGAGMMSYSASFPVPPYGVSPYMPSMYGGMPDPSGNMRPPQNPDYFGLQHSGNAQKQSNENNSREKYSDNGDGSPETYRHSYPEKPHDNKSQKRKEPSLSHSGNSSRRSSRRSQHDKHTDSDRQYVDERNEKGSHSSAGRDKKSHAERSNSGKEERSKSSGRHTEGRFKQHAERSNSGKEEISKSSGRHTVERFKQHAERSNSGKEEISKSSGRHTEGRFKHHGPSDYESRHPRQSGKYSRDLRYDERRHDRRDEHDRHKHDHHEHHKHDHHDHHHKRKRIY